jgi:hypothetical protein
MMRFKCRCCALAGSARPPSLQITYHAVDPETSVSSAGPSDVGAYPIGSFEWFVSPTHVADDARRNAITGFLRRMPEPGQKEAAAPGYPALPHDVASNEEDVILRIH